jgi:hypothetical protein
MVAIFVELTLTPTACRRQKKKIAGHRAGIIQNAIVLVGTRQEIVTTKNGLQLFLLPKLEPDVDSFP